MPISPMDEYLAHQTTDTFDHVATSDRNFYDRYYFNAHDSTGDVFLVTGMGQYPNLGVIDAFVAISHGTSQYVVRASRALGNDRLDTSVGPFSVEVIEGLRALRVACDENEWGVAFDLRFDGTVPALEEPKTFTRSRARVTMDVSRYAQVGTWTGWLEVAGERYEVTPDRWKGARDRSWGIRPVGEREPPGIGIEDVQQGRHGFYHNWIPLQLDRGMFKVMYDADWAGTPLVEEAAFVPAIGEAGGIVRYGSPRIEIEYLPGTREMKRAHTRLPNPDGEDVTIESIPQRTVYLAAGTGYLPTPDWGHGFYKGRSVTEGLVFDLSTQEKRSQYAILNETLCRFELGTGEVAYGMHENMCLGVYQPHGFDEPGKMAP
jgi:hypothetical protein